MPKVKKDSVSNQNEPVEQSIEKPKLVRQKAMKNLNTSKKSKKPKKPTEFAIFVKEHYNTVKDLPNNQRLKALSVKYHESKK